MDGWSYLGGANVTAMATDDSSSVSALSSRSNVLRSHYSDISKAIGPFPDLLLSLSNRFYQYSFIDLQTKSEINRSSGLTGVSMLLDHVMMKVDQSDQYIPLVMDILREEVALTDIVREMERERGSSVQHTHHGVDLVVPDSATKVTQQVQQFQVGQRLQNIDPYVSSTTVANTISTAERLLESFQILIFCLMSVISRTRVHVASLKSQICLRLQYSRDNTPPEVREHLANLEQCPSSESVIMFLINSNFLGYLNFDLLNAVKPVLSSNEFGDKLLEYTYAHEQFIKNHFQNIVELFNQKPLLRPASIVGLPEFKVELKTAWKSRSLYYWKELVNDIVNWGPYIVITRVEFNCISITYQVLPFIIPRVVMDLTNEAVVKRFTAIGATFTIPDKLVQEGIADNQWITDTIHEQILLKKARNETEENDDLVTEKFKATAISTVQPLEEVQKVKPKLPLKPSRHVKDAGGYNDELFLSPSPGDLQCPVCYLTVREPHQLSCCGATLCQVCSDSTSSSVQCPCCRDTNHQIMVDKSARRKVMGLLVKCTVPDCHWIGELLDLRKHLTIKDKCPQLIGYDASIVPMWCHQELPFLHYEILPVYRTIKLFNEHNAVLYTDPFYTSDGGYKATLAVYPNGDGTSEGTYVSAYISLMKGPNDDNLQFPVTGIFTAQILNWDGNNHHVEKKILFDDGVPLKNRERVTTGEDTSRWGIGRFLSHDDLMSYLHKDMMCFKITFDPSTGCSPVPSWCDVTYSTSATPPCTRTLSSYDAHKNTDSQWLSQPFYSSDKGYKLQLKVYANGSRSGKGTHLSLVALLMKGEYDDTLSWPFNATITVQLLNWASDNHHETRDVHHYEAPIEYRQRVVEGTRAPKGMGIHFIPHDSLECEPGDSTMGIRFINDISNDICFRIANVHTK